MNDLVYIARRNGSLSKTKTHNYKAIIPNTKKTFNYEKKPVDYKSGRKDNKDKPDLGRQFKNKDDFFRKSHFEKTFWNGNINISNISSFQNQQTCGVNIKHSNNKQIKKEELVISQKPSTASYSKRPIEKLRKGQNQLIYERLLEKININKKANYATTNNFFNSTRLKTFNTIESEAKEKSPNKTKLKEGKLTTKHKHINSKSEFLSCKENDKDSILCKNEVTEFEPKKPYATNTENKNNNNYPTKDQSLRQSIKENSPKPAEHINESSSQESDKKNYIDTEKVYDTKSYLGKTQPLFSIKESLPKFSKEIKFSESSQNAHNENKETQYQHENTKKKFEDIDLSDVIKRVLEKNRKQAESRQKAIFTPPLNLNSMNQTQGRFFIGSSTKQNFFPPIEKSGNILELVISDLLMWKKHEEIWNSVSNNRNSTPTLFNDFEKYLLPPNDLDVLLSSYCKTNEVYMEKIVIDETIKNPREEIQKWKKAYKRAVMRWHPDKLFANVDSFKLKDENKRNLLKKKAAPIMNNLNKLLKTILEILNKIVLSRE